MKRVKKPAKIRFRQALFWDVDPKTIDPKKHAQYVIERILQLGNDNEVRWMYRTYPRRRLQSVVNHSRAIDGPTRALWKELVK